MSWEAVILFVNFSALTLPTVERSQRQHIKHRVNKLKVVTKSALVGIIHHKTIGLPSATHDNSEAITLMSTDVDGLDGVAEMFHETWAQILEVIIGIFLLSREVGSIWPLPLILIFRRFKKLMALYVTANT